MMVAGAPEAQSGRTYLHRNWQIQSSCEAAATGEQISSGIKPTFRPRLSVRW